MASLQLALTGGDPRNFKGQRLVLKLGGEIMLNTTGIESLASQIASMSEEGLGVVVVHGGGPQADEMAARLGHKVRKIAGRRITGDEDLEIAKMVYGGSINIDVLSALKRHGARGVGISGVDANLVTVKRRPLTLVRDPQTGDEEWVDFGHVGDIAAVDVSILWLLLKAGCVPVVASLAAGEDGRIYNVNADTIAQSIAVALHASKLVLLTNVPGILRDPRDPSSLVSECDVAELAALVEKGAISGGMLPKVQNCIEAIRAGIPEVQILDGTHDRIPLQESLTKGRAGTTIAASRSQRLGGGAGVLP